MASKGKDRKSLSLGTLAYSAEQLAAIDRILASTPPVVVDVSKAL